MDFTEYQLDVQTRIKTIMAEENIAEPNAFFKVACDTFAEYGIAEDVSSIEMSDTKAGSKAMRIDAYSFDETDHSLNLFIYDYNDGSDPGKLTSTLIDKAYWRLYYYLETACSPDAAKYLPKNEDGYLAAVLIRNRMNCPVTDPERILKVHFIVVTNRELDSKIYGKDFFSAERSAAKKNKKAKSTKKLKKEEFIGRPVDIDVWPLERFYEIVSADSTELIEIDFESEFGFEGIPCLKGNIGADLDYEAYLGIIPGKLLADIYIEYGSRVLEGNVRAFLGTKSAKGVNSGIKRTINNDPTQFFTYNNGIAVTAADITTTTKNGQLFITGITDMQIINGGQTTATLAEAVLKKTNPSLDGIFVPVKLTVIRDREEETEDGALVYDQMIHDIARFANSQNKVTASDLFSNDPFHIWMEKSSKRYLTPTVHYNIPTGWYYERSRKKYQQEQFKLKGPEQKKFLAKFPKKQIITKEQLALYLTALAGKPHLCAKGKNWVMKEYGSSIGELYKKDKSSFNEYYFKKCICAAIIYLAVDNYLESNKKDPDFWYSAGGFKGNIVPYAIAKIMVSLPANHTLNWQSIWSLQGLSPAFMKEIELVTKKVNDYFCSCSGVLISEHCKKESTWTMFRDTCPYIPSKEFLDELIPVSMDKELGKSAQKDQRDTDELVLVMGVIEKGAAYWQEIYQKGVACNTLSAVDQNNLRDLITFIMKGQIPLSASGKVPYKTMALIKKAIEIESALNDEGVTTYFEDEDETVEMTLTNYKMH